MAINSGLAIALMEDAVAGAMRVYRLRFLTEKYGLDAEAWTENLDPDPASPEEGESIVPIEVLPEDHVDPDTDLSAEATSTD